MSKILANYYYFMAWPQFGVVVLLQGPTNQKAHF